MPAYDPEFARRPHDFIRRRSWARTTVFLTLAVVFAIVLVFVLVNYVDLREAAATRHGTMRYEVGQRVGTLVAPVFLGLVVIGCALAAWRWGRVWFVASTGTRVRRRFYRGMAGGRPVYERLLTMLRTGDPSAFTPLPSSSSFTDVDIEIWTAAADRAGFATLVLHEGTKPRTLTYSEPVRFEGDAYDRLSAALAAGLDSRFIG